MNVKKLSKAVVALVIITTTTACGVVHQAQLNAASKNAQQQINEKCSALMNVSAEEAQAWESTLADLKTCTKDVPEPWPRDQTLAIGACITEPMNQKIKPVSHSKKKFAALMAERAEDQKLYADGKISWAEGTASGAKRLERYFGTANAGSYYSFASCGNDVIAQVVMPTYQLKPLLMEYMTNMAAFSRQADKQKMAKEDFQIGAQRLWTDFASKEQTVISQQRAQNAAAWQNFGQQLQQQQAQRAAIQAQQRASIPKTTTTNCQFIGNMMQCTEF